MVRRPFEDAAHDRHIAARACPPDSRCRATRSLRRRGGECIATAPCTGARFGLAGARPHGRNRRHRRRHGAPARPGRSQPDDRGDADRDRPAQYDRRPSLGPARNRLQRAAGIAARDRAARPAAHAHAAGRGRRPLARHHRRQRCWRASRSRPGPAAGSASIAGSPADRRRHLDLRRLGGDRHQHRHRGARRGRQPMRSPASPCSARWRC